METIKFMGVELTLTPEMKYISLDEDGTISGYPIMPILIEDQEGASFWCDGETSSCDALLYVLELNSFTEEDWRATPTRLIIRG